MPKISVSKRKERKRLILQAALEVFSETGYCSATIDDIVKKANISKGLIYTYFKSKEEIFLDLVEYWQEISKKDNKELNTDKDLKDKKLSEGLLILWDSIVNQWTSENLLFARIQYEFWLESSRNPELQELMKDKAKASLQSIEKLINEGNIKIEPSMAAAFSRLWWSQVDGLVAYFISHGTTPDGEEMKRIREIIKHMCEFLDKTEN
ncbi:TetR/AcrR family transcriptional regulator [Bacillus stratosphericus]|uniref:TetR/AcrR family transcriptional regulator n=1 Tax=Bacillus stratosphericus TaxID=293386 RepID=UPI001CFA6899|nr:TetR/AcrR family transcriptional regulator [Bacillus stratosphericus]